jgi:hypothetical protein
MQGLGNFQVLVLVYDLYLVGEVEKNCKVKDKNDTEADEISHVIQKVLTQAKELEDKGGKDGGQLDPYDDPLVLGESHRSSNDVGGNTTHLHEVDDTFQKGFTKRVVFKHVLLSEHKECLDNHIQDKSVLHVALFFVLPCQEQE